MRLLRDHPSHLFVSAVWNLWCRRNVAVFSGENWSDCHILNLMYSLANDVLHCPTDSNLFNAPISASLWCVPSAGVLKLNVDGSVFESLNHGGFGGIV